MAKAAVRLRREWLFLAGAALALVAGVLSGWRRVGGGGGVDFAVLHAMGVAIARGANVYALNAPGETRSAFAGVTYPPATMGVVVYPPSTGFLMAPLGLLPYQPALVAWFAMMNGAVVFGIRSLVRRLRPEAGAHVWMLTAALVLLSSGVRWGMMLLQGAPLVLGLLCFFLVLLHEERRDFATAAVVALVAAFKITLSAPFVGLLLLHRRLRSIFAAGATWAALNALGFLRMGHGALDAYRSSTAAFEAVGDAYNINSPNPWTLVSLPRLDWAYLFYGLTGVERLSRTAGLICAVMTALWLLREGLRLSTSFADSCLLVGPLVCLGSLSVYHHQYDLCLFLVPMILTAFGPPGLRRPTWGLLLQLPVILMVSLLPIGAAGSVLLAAFGPPGVSVMKLMFPAAITLALAGSAVVLRGAVQRQPATAS